MVIAFLKGLIPGVALALIVATIIGRQGSTGGFLYIHHEYIYGYGFLWSWPVFVTVTLISGAIMWMMDS